MNIMSGLGTFPLPNIVKPKPVDKVLMEATVKKARVDGIKMKVSQKSDIFKHAPHKVPVSFYLTVFWNGHCI